MRSSQPKYVRNECKAAIGDAVVGRRPLRVRKSALRPRRSPPRRCNGMLVPYRPLASWSENARFGVCSSARYAPGRMLSIPTLNCGARRSDVPLGSPKSPIRPHGTAAYAGPRRPASERVPGVVVGLPWGHCRWGSHLELELDADSPVGRPKRTGVAHSGEWGGGAI